MFFIHIVPQGSAFVVERLGVYQATWSPGLHVRIPFIDRVARRISLKEQVANFPPQRVITSDNVNVEIDSVVFFHVEDPVDFTYKIMEPIEGISNLVATTLRSYIGNLTLEETMTSREQINEYMTKHLNASTSKWGISINKVEILDIVPPADVTSSMEKQIKAEREKRAMILMAEAEKQSAILIAEGHKESKVLEAEADKKAAILQAEAEKEARALRAEGEKQAKILQADGEAEAIFKIKDATAKGIEKINQSKPSEEYLALQQIDAMKEIGSSKSSKLIIPSDLQKIASTVSAIKESVDLKDSTITEENY